MESAALSSSVSAPAAALRALAQVPAVSASAWKDLVTTISDAFHQQQRFNQSTTTLLSFGFTALQYFKRRIGVLERQAATDHELIAQLEERSLSATQALAAVHNRVQELSTSLCEHEQCIEDLNTRLHQQEDISQQYALELRQHAFQIDHQQSQLDALALQQAQKELILDLTLLLLVAALVSTRPVRALTTALVRTVLRSPAHVRWAGWLVRLALVLSIFWRVRAWLPLSSDGTVSYLRIAALCGRRLLSVAQSQLWRR